MAAHEGALKHRAWQIEERRKARLEAERRERERQERLERERVERLLGEADALRRAQAIRDYVAQVERLQAEARSSCGARSPNRASPRSARGKRQGESAPSSHGRPSAS